MSADMQVTLEGLPECVQEAADILDRAFPGLMTWQRFAIPGRDCAIRLETEPAARNAVLPQPGYSANRAVSFGKPWKVSPAAGTLSQPGQFCASLSKSFTKVSEPGDALPGATTER